MRGKIFTSCRVVLPALILGFMIFEVFGGNMTPAGYPEKGRFLPEVMVVETREPESVAPGLVLESLTVWTVEGPICLHLLHAAPGGAGLLFKKSPEKPGAIPPGAHAAQVELSFSKAVKVPSAGLAFSQNALPAIGDFSADSENETGPFPVLLSKGAIAAGLQDEKGWGAGAPETLCAMGTTAKGAMIIIFADGTRPLESVGMNPAQMAEYCLYAGCTDAILISRGDSAEMSARLPGETGPVSLSGRFEQDETADSAHIAVYDITPPGKTADILIEPESLIMAAGDRVTFSVRPVDEQGRHLPGMETRVTPSPADLVAIEGLICAAGDRAGEGRIVFETGGFRKTIPVRVITGPAAIRIDREALALLQGEEAVLNLTGVTRDGREYEIPPDSVKWEVPPGCGEFVSPGTFRAGSGEGSGRLTARVIEAEASIPIVVGSVKSQIADFRGLSGWRVTTSPPQVLGSYDYTIAAEDGAGGAALINYNFSGVTRPAEIMALKNFPMPGVPRRLFFRIYAVHSDQTLSGIYSDSLGRDHRIRIAQTTSRRAWINHEVELPEGTAYPIIWRGFVIRDAKPSGKGSGSIQIQDIQGMYAPAVFESGGDCISGDFPPWLVQDLRPAYNGKPDLRLIVFGNAAASNNDPEGPGSVIINKIVESADSRNAGLVVSTGNLTSEGNAISLAFVKNKLDRLRCAWHTTIGRGEILNDTAVLNYPKIMKPTHAALDMGNISLFFLDNTAGGFRASDALQRPSERQWPWLLKEIGKSGADVFLFFCHYSPVFDTKGQEGMNIQETRTLHKLMKSLRDRGKKVMVFSGDRPGLRIRVREGIPYIMTGGAGADLDSEAASGGFYNYLEINIQGERVYFSARPVVTRLAMKRHPVKNRVGSGEELAFTGSGLWIDPPQRSGGKRLVFPLVPAMSYGWRVEGQGVGEIESRDGVFRALGPGTASIHLDTGDFSIVEGVTVLRPGD